MADCVTLYISTPIAANAFVHCVMRSYLASGPQLIFQADEFRWPPAAPGRAWAGRDNGGWGGQDIPGGCIRRTGIAALNWACLSLSPLLQLLRSSWRDPSAAARRAHHSAAAFGAAGQGRRWRQGGR